MPGPRSGPEARLAGAATELGGLLEALTALSGSEGGELRSYECVQRKDGPPAVEVTLRRSLLPGAEPAGALGHRWTVVNETRLQRGIVRDLPVAVVMVTQASSEGPEAPVFWEGLGSHFARESVRVGRVFYLTVDNQTVRVMVSRLLRVVEQHNPGKVEDVSGGSHLVEIACKTQAGAYDAATAACMRVREQLADWVALTRD